MKRLLIVLPVVCCLLLTACGRSSSGESSTSRDVFAMDTYITVTCTGEQCEEAADAAVEEIDRLENLLSVGIEDSEIAQINRTGSGMLSAEVLPMVEQALDLWQTTGGAFDITIYPLMDLWGFTTEDFAVPAPEEIQYLLQYVGCDKLSLNENTGQIVLGENQGIDLGGIAKGYTLNHLAELFDSYDLTSAVISLGGDVLCYGTKADGSEWRVGVQDPLNPDDSSSFLGILTGIDIPIVTSGAYERYFVDEETGTTWHHILDPATGYSSDSGLLSVTVICENGMKADGLSTAFFVMGLDKSTEYWRTYGEDFDMILMTEDETVYVTPGIADQFTSDYTVSVLS